MKQRYERFKYKKLPAELEISHQLRISSNGAIIIPTRKWCMKHVLTIIIIVAFVGKF